MLGTPFNYRAFVGGGTIDFPKSMDMSDIVRSCTIARGQLILQAQPENSLWDIKQCILGAPAPSLDTLMASICVSFPKIKNLGDMNSYIEGLYVVTTLKKMTDNLCEITCVNNSFFIAFMQPFSSFEYYRFFLKRAHLLTTHGDLRHVSLPLPALIAGILSAFCVMIYNVLAPKITDNIPVIVAQGWSFILGGVLLGISGSKPYK